MPPEISSWSDVLERPLQEKFQQDVRHNHKLHLTITYKQKIKKIKFDISNPIYFPSYENTFTFRLFLNSPTYCIA